MRRWGVMMMLPFMIASVAWAADGRAQGVVPPLTELPTKLTLADAVRMFRTQGLDLLIAEASVRSAEGQVKIADAVPNPVASAAWGRGINYDPSGCDQCSATYWQFGLSDSAAIEDSLSGKRDLRVKAARNALAAARMSRADAERTLVFQVKSAYLQVAQSILAYRFAKEVADSTARTLDLFQARFRSGAINEGDVARITTQKLEADQALDQASQVERQSRVALAFLLGIRGALPVFDVDSGILGFHVPDALTDADEDRLLRAAFERRPDLVGAGYQRASAEAQIALVRRQQFPDITLSLGYSQMGTGGNAQGGAVTPPTFTVGLSAPLPIFYQLEGERRQAQAQVDTTALQQAKAAATVASDVATAFSAFTTSRKLVERMEGAGLLQSAKTARDVTRLQYEKGAAGLTDYLDAQRTYIATNVEYFQDLTNYWTAVFQLEQAIGMELH
jgi:cobalt-zinc-cadmium efflux system outer membrane protein